jgi:Ser/Thr protein kinase RdoA (MazF antagonist)
MNIAIQGQLATVLWPMIMTAKRLFPVSHSTLDADALAAELARRLQLRSVRCRLVSRGSNDLYRIESDTGVFALRVARARHRSSRELDYELCMMRQLSARGLPVPTPVTLRSGKSHFSVRAPEGVRAISLFSWVDGTPLSKTMTSADARAAGRLLAEMHGVLAGFNPPKSKNINTVSKIEDKLRYIDNILPQHSQHRLYFDNALEEIRAFFIVPLIKALPRGATHGDFQFANLMRSSEGRLWVIDFDECGFDILAKDLITFEWRARLDGLPSSTIRAFHSGYRAVRPLIKEETRALPFLRLARDVYLLVSYAAYIDRIGPVQGFNDQSRIIQLMLDDLQAVQTLP